MVIFERVAGNFIVGFATAFTAISVVDGLTMENKLYAGVLAGVGQGALAAGKDLLKQTEGKKGQAAPLLSVF